jgi:hypothetical protein
MCPIGFLFLKLPPPPCAVLLVVYILHFSSLRRVPGNDFFEQKQHFLLKTKIELVPVNTRLHFERIWCSLTKEACLYDACLLAEKGNIF